MSRCCIELNLITYSPFSIVSSKLDFIALPLLSRNGCANIYHLWTKLNFISWYTHTNTHKEEALVHWSSPGFVWRGRLYLSRLRSYHLGRPIAYLCVCMSVRLTSLLALLYGCPFGRAIDRRHRSLRCRGDAVVDLFFLFIYQFNG